MLPLHAQAGLPLLLMPATCSGKAASIPKLYFPSAEFILIYSADPAGGAYEANYENPQNMFGSLCERHSKYSTETKLVSTLFFFLFAGVNAQCEKLLRTAPCARSAGPGRPAV